MAVVFFAMVVFILLVDDWQRLLIIDFKCND
jgi:hypothetical protein